MRLKKAFWGALLVSGSLGAGTAAALDNDARDSRQSPSERYPTSVSDDETLAPGVPGVTEENSGNMSERQARAAEETLADRGYDPGRIDGNIDSDTRAAIREFQKDNDLTVTGNIDHETELQLGMGRSGSIERSDSMERNSPRS